MIDSEIDPIEEFEVNSPEIRLELVDGRFVVGGSLNGSLWLLREIIQGWGMESAIAFAAPHLWYDALRTAFEIDSSISNLAEWAEQTSYQIPEIPPLGSKYVGEHWIARDRLSEDLRRAIGRASLGQCIGKDFVTHIGSDAFTPDVIFVHKDQLDRYHQWFFDGSPDLVIEVLIPEHAHIDRSDRLSRYEAGGVRHYITVDPAQQQVEIFRLTNAGYQLVTLDPDGCYRGIENLTFVPGHIWLPYSLRLPIFEAPYLNSDYELRDVEGSDLIWGTL